MAYLISPHVPHIAAPGADTQEDKRLVLLLDPGQERPLFWSWSFSLWDRYSQDFLQLHLSLQGQGPRVPGMLEISKKIKKKEVLRMILSCTLLLFLGLSSQTLMVPPTYISLGLRGSQVANLGKTCMDRVGMHGAPHGAGWSSGGPKRRRPW